MAELDVVKKRKSPLPWILIALVLLALVAYLVWSNSDRAETAGTVTTEDTTVINNGSSGN